MVSQNLVELFVRVKVVIFIVYWVEKIIFNLGVTKFFQFNKKVALQNRKSGKIHRFL